jgi:hypothetical protein
MPIVKLDPPYKHLYQKPAFCGPCCVQMVEVLVFLLSTDQFENIFSVNNIFYGDMIL